MDIFKLKEILESKKYTVNSSELKELIEKSVENYSSYDDKAKILNDIYKNYIGCYKGLYCDINDKHRDFPILIFKYYGKESN